ncbi:sensor histidine kinase [Micromonospora citrea]|uniref:sensor histidine kinase n=1 Tax=Micromonospora citrea TaxID=47855 RepID=UPI003C3C69B4
MVVLLALHRVGCFVPALVSSAQGLYHSRPANLLLLAVVLGWNVLLFRTACRWGWFPAPMVHLDVVLAVLVLVLVAGNLSTNGVLSNWGNGATQTAASLAAAAIVRPLAVVAVVGGLVVVRTAVGLGFAADTSPVELLYAANGIACFALAAGFGIRYLRREGRHLDRVNAQRLAAEAERAADHARYVTRVAHHRALHDTVLTTLTLIARGGVDHRTAPVRQRCARDADYIRGLLADRGDTGFGTLGAALREVVGAASLLGLRVRFRGDLTPPELPPAVVDALRDATREALNNVVKHADVDEAWVTVTREGGVLRVTVVDRGCGFEPETVPPGFGFRHSVVDRVAEVGGRVRVSSEPGAGTCVELSWPR